MSEKEKNGNDIISGPRPVIRLSLSDKIYLASLKSPSENGVNVYVYSLTLRRVGNNFVLPPRVEVAGFENDDAASLFYDAVENISELYTSHPAILAMDSVLAPFVDNFRKLER